MTRGFVNVRPSLPVRREEKTPAAAAPAAAEPMPDATDEMHRRPRPTVPLKKTLG